MILVSLPYDVQRTILLSYSFQEFDCILMDLHMPVRECIIIIAAMLRVLTFPVVGGEGAARYIKGTNGNNSSTPIIAISSYGGAGPTFLQLHSPNQYRRLTC